MTKMNPHLKLAYEHGVRTALQEAGITKTSGININALAGAGQHASSGIMARMGRQAPKVTDELIDLAQASDRALDKAYGYGVQPRSAYTAVRDNLGSGKTLFGAHGAGNNLGSAEALQNYIRSVGGLGNVTERGAAQAIHRGWMDSAGHGRRFGTAPSQMKNPLSQDYWARHAKTEANMVPYDQLSQGMKDIDVTAARGMLEHLRGLA